MPSLELPNLAAYRYQAQQTPPPLAMAPVGPIVPMVQFSAPRQTQTQSSPLPASQANCSCPPGVNLSIPQGATSSTPFNIVVNSGGVQTPVDITGNQFEFTAKTDPALPDTDPSVVKVDWTETKTPTQGQTILVIASTLTATMQLATYFFQVWMVSSVTLPTPVVTPLFTGTLTVTQPISGRH